MDNTYHNSSILCPFLAIRVLGLKSSGVAWNGDRAGITASELARPHSSGLIVPLQMEETCRSRFEGLGRGQRDGYQHDRFEKVVSREDRLLCRDHMRRLDCCTSLVSLPCRRHPTARSRDRRISISTDGPGEGRHAISGWNGRAKPSRRPRGGSVGIRTEHQQQRGSCRRSRFGVGQ